jgi:aspartyl-tRNA(Asn)/glutamyl-tRNA(Gln) amidotransferase subunit A
MFENYSFLREKLFSGSVSCIDTVKHYLNIISQKSYLNAFITVFDEEALQRAELIDEKIRNGSAGRLAGMVISVKDVLSYKAHRMTCGSKILADFEPLYTCSAVQKLIDEDAIIIGKTNCDEFAMGSSNENSAYGAVYNPHDKMRVPGGSSGGSAVSVAAGMCMASLGTDTGGSVRQPASFCGIIGFKPTYGRVSRFGLTAFASSFDTIGIFSNNIEDAAVILSVISGKDKNDSTSADVSVHDYHNQLNSTKKYRIGTVKLSSEEGLQKEVLSFFNETIEKLKYDGHEIKEIELPYTRFGIQTYYILTTAEASSNLARYDGARFGIRSENFNNLEEMYVNSRSEGFGKEVKRRIMLGTYVLSHGYYDAYYRKAQKMRRLIRDDYSKAFELVDLILMPSTPTTAFKIGEKIDDPLAMYLNDVFTTSTNLAGIPAISIPIGIQIIGREFDEQNVLNLGKMIE